MVHGPGALDAAFGRRLVVSELEVPLLPGQAVLTAAVGLKAQGLDQELGGRGGIPSVGAGAENRADRVHRGNRRMVRGEWRVEAVGDPSSNASPS